MPPGRKSKQLPTFIQPVSGQEIVRCTLCDQNLKRDSLNGHLKSAGHKKSEALHQAAAAKTQERKAEQSASVVAKEAIEYAMLTNVPVPDEHRTSGSVSDARVGRSSARPSAQEDMLWSSLEQDHSDLGLGIDDASAAARRNRERLEEGISMFGLWDPTRAASDLGFLFGQEPSQPPDEVAPEALDVRLSAPGEEDSYLAELLGNIDLDHAHRVSGNASYGNDDTRTRSPVDRDSDTYPYPNYPTLLADVLDNGLTRLPVPESLMKLFLYVLRECGVQDAPTLYELRSIQRDLRKKCGVPSIPCKTPQGNIFWMVDPRAIIARDWTNEETRRDMHVYPVIPDGPISEVFHTVRWHKGIDRSTLSPMYDARDKHYYLDELCRLANGEFAVPQRWVIYRKAVHAEVFRLTTDPQGNVLVDKTSADLVPVASLHKNLYDLMAEDSLPVLGADPEDFVYATPNPLREVAEGDPLYSSYVNHFADDVSGNRSKSWNKHYNAYITHANLPRRFLQQEAHIHFVSTSPHASATEQFYHFKQVVESTHTQPVRVFDPLTRGQTRFRIFVHAEPSDNPMQSEISGHIGGNGNLFCRKCKAGGTTEDKESNDGFHALFEPGDPRSKDFILAELRAQVKLACLGVEKPVKERQTQHGIKDAYTQYFIDDLLRRARTIKKDSPGRTDTDIQQELLTWVDANTDQIYNPFLTMRGLDPTLDTPIEILHTVLLGVVKYAWHWSHTSWSTAQKATYAHRLQATNTDALSIHAIRSNYILQYANSLIGRQLKTIVQTTSFHVHDILDPLKFALWLAVGEMTALIWFPEIEDLDTYQADLKTAIANVLDLFAEIDPSKIVEKVKLHVLSHAPEDVARFGPLLGVITESFESFNGTFRSASIHSNHIAPSRDIAVQLADQEALKHRLMGGYWLADMDEYGGTWTQAGPRVRDFLRDHPGLQGVVGWRPSTPPQPGTVKLLPVPTGTTVRPLLRLRDVPAASHALNSATYSFDTPLWTRCKHAVAQSEDVCIINSWICAQSPLNDQTVVLGRIEDILTHQERAQALVVLDVFEVAATRHPVFSMPQLSRRFDEKSYLIVDVQKIKFSFNVQHDCARAGCTASGRRKVKQERTDSDVLEQYIEHNVDVQHYIINTHSLHNPHLIRSILPRNLVEPIPRFKDRRSEHDKMAERLRHTRDGKRAEQKARKAEKKAKAGLAKAQASLTGTGAHPAGSSAGDIGSSDTTVAVSQQQQPSSRPRARPKKRPRVEEEDGENVEGPSEADAR